MLGMNPPTVGPPTMNQQQAPQGFGHGMSLGQSPGLGQGIPGLSPNPLEQQHQMQMLVRALQQQGGMR